MAVRVTQLPVEVLQDTKAPVRLSQLPVHVAWKNTGAEARIAQATAHAAWESESQNVRISQMPIHLASAARSAEIEVLPYLIIPPGQGQTIDELEGHSSIPTLNFETIDLRGELKALAAKTDIVGKLGRFRLGFPGMAMEDFVVLHTTQLTDVGRIAEGRMSFETVELLNFVTGEIWTKGGPHSAPSTTSDPPAPPLFEGFAANAYEISDQNPRYLYGHPIDILLLAYQNELGIGQDDPDPGTWDLFEPGNDATLINPNPYLDVPGLLALRDGMFSGVHFEFKVTKSEAGKRWTDDQILKVLGLYTIIRPDGSLSFKSMKSPANPLPVAMTRHGIIGIPEISRLPVQNVVVVRMAVDDSSETAARSYQTDYTFQEQTSIQRYKQQYKTTIEASGLRLNYGGYRLAFLLADRIFRRHAFATVQYEIVAKLMHIDLEVGDFILLSHDLVLDEYPLSANAGKLGLTDVLCEIVDKQPDYANGRVTFKVLDTRFMSLTTPWNIAPAAAELPDWGEATEEQRNSYMFISFAPDGVYSDDAPGREIF